MLTDHDLRTAFHDHRDSIYQFAWRMTNSRSTADDILQEVFLAALRNPDRFEQGRGELRPFLLGIARNVALKRLRDESRWTPLEETDFIAPPIDLENFDPTAALAEAVQHLPPLQREALILATYEELPLNDIAVLTSTALGTVKARLHRARENLKGMLAPLKPGLQGSTKTWNR